MRRRGGYSFLELIILLAICGIMAAIAFPRMANATNRYRLDFAARRIVSDLERARSNARLTGVTQTVAFDLTLHRYTVSGNTNGLAAGTLVDLTSDPTNAKLSSANFAGSTPTTSISFDVYGQPTSGGTVVISAGASSRTITLDAASGKGSWQ